MDDFKTILSQAEQARRLARDVVWDEASRASLLAYAEELEIKARNLTERSQQALPGDGIGPSGQFHAAIGNEPQPLSPSGDKPVTEYWRRRAEELRIEAAASDSDKTRTILNRLSDECDRLADTFEASKERS